MCRLVAFKGHCSTSSAQSTGLISRCSILIGHGPLFFPLSWTILRLGRLRCEAHAAIASYPKSDCSRAPSPHMPRGQLMDPLAYSAATAKTIVTYTPTQENAGR